MRLAPRPLSRRTRPRTGSGPPPWPSPAVWPACPWQPSPGVAVILRCPARSLLPGAFSRILDAGTHPARSGITVWCRQDGAASCLSGGSDRETGGPRRELPFTGAQAGEIGHYGQHPARAPWLDVLPAAAYPGAATYSGKAPTRTGCGIGGAGLACTRRTGVRGQETTG